MLGVIFARALDGAMGKDGTLPWSVPEDMALFKRVTTGHPVIMGRRTWESLPERFRPLPDRSNFVVTHDGDYEAPGAVICSSLEQAVARARRAEGSEQIWLIGGAGLIAEALKTGMAQAAMVTDLNLEVPGADTFAPMLDFSWEIASTTPERGWNRSTKGVEYRFTLYRKPGSSIMIFL